MNNLEKLLLLEELVALRRQTMHIDEAGEGYHQLQKSQQYYDKKSGQRGDKPVVRGFGEPAPRYEPKRDPVSSKKPWEVKESASISSGKNQVDAVNRVDRGEMYEAYESSYKSSMEEDVGAGRGNPGTGLETQNVGSGPSSRTGLDEVEVRCGCCEQCGHCSCPDCARHPVQEAGFGATGAAHGQDAEYSSDRKRGHEGDPHLEESLDSYWKIAGLL